MEKDVDPPSMEPYRPPRETSGLRERKPRIEPLTIACFLWAAIAVKILFAGQLLGPVFDDFELELPLLTRVLLHPMASVFVFAAALAMMLASYVFDDRTQRYRLGSIALILGMITLLACVYAMVQPLLALLQDLS